MRAPRLPRSLQATLVTALSLFASISAQTCTSVLPVGLADQKVIPINRIVTSSDLTDHGKDQIRLNCCEGTTGNAWCPNSNDTHPYVEVHLDKPMAIGQIVIQPPTVTNQDTEFPENFLKSFDLLFKLPELKEFVTYAKDIDAIVNKTITVNTIWLQQAMVTDVVRVVPRDSENLPCFRMELYSCEVTSLCPKDYCQNNGTCSGPNTCDCPAGYFGEKCQFSMLSIPKTVYSFLKIVGNTIITSIDTLTFHGDVTLDISNTLILKPGSYIDLNSLTANSCYANLDTCFSGFTLNFDFSFSKLDTGSQVVLTNGAGLTAGIKGITLLFNKGELHCYVVTSTKRWTVVTSFTIEELSWYEMSISWSPSQGLLVLHGNTLVGSSYLAETLDTAATITNNFMIGYDMATTTAELHWRYMAVYQLFWQDVKRAGLLTATTLAPTTSVAVTPQQVTACTSVLPVGISDPEVIPSDRIVTSSNLKDHGKDQIRLNCCEGSTGNAWCPDSDDKSPYVEINLAKPMAIGRIVIQPPTVKNQVTEYPENFLKSFDLFFKLPGVKELVTYGQDISAITNKTISLNTIWLQHSIVTDVIRIVPRQSENLPCFRMELYSCNIATLCPQGYCQNEGNCSGPNTCDCPAAYFGERCQYLEHTIPKVVYSFLEIVHSTIITSADILTFHGEVTLDISKSLIIKPGSYIDLSSLTASSCYTDLDTCFSGFTLNFVFSFSKLDTGSKVVLTNGAGIDAGIKGITLLFDKGELHCFVVTSTQLWKVVRSFTLKELSWYEISISWSPSHGLLVLQGSSLIGSSYIAETLATMATITNTFVIGYHQATTTAELHWKSLTIIQLFWQDVKRADLLAATTPAPTTVTAAPTTSVAVTGQQDTACSSVSPVGISDPGVFSSSRIVTSSDSLLHGKDQIRLNCCEEKSGNAWCPDSTDKKPFVEIHLEKPVAISRIAFQPPTVTNPDTEFPVNFMKSFDLFFQLPNVKELVAYAQDIRAIGNKTITLNTIWLQQAIVTDLIRIEPRTSENLPCFRMELYTCEVTSLCAQDYCQNNGTCSGPSTCDCPASYFGEKCQYSKQTIPKVVYRFLRIVDSTIITSLDILTFHGEVTLDINRALILKPGSYIDLSSLSLSSCYADLDSCFSGFTLNFGFSFSKLDTGSKVVLTNGAGIEAGIKGITLLFDKGELHCFVVTSTQVWKVVMNFTLEELSWYDMSISWNPSQGLLVLQNNSLIGSSYLAETLATVATITNNYGIGYHQATTTAELHWKSLTIIQLFWQDVMRADLLPITTPAPTTVPASTTTTAAVTAVQIPKCSSLSPVGIAEPKVIPSSSIEVSSELKDHGKDQIRLNCCAGTIGNAWCPDTSDKSPYVEIHLEKPVAVGRIDIQAPTSINQTPDLPANFMKSFDLLFQLPGLKEMVTVAQNIDAIVNETILLSSIWLSQAIVTDVIRIEPRTSQNLPCFRMELYSCDAASLCPQDYCQNDGTCSGPNTCNCSSSFFGERCQYIKEKIPKAVYLFEHIVGNLILTSIDSLTFHGEVTVDINNTLIIKPGSYIDLSSLTASSCYANLDTCSSGFTLNFVFSFSKLDTGTKVVLTNGAGIEAGIKGITLLFDKGELQCFVVTSTQLWKVVRSFTLEELSWYKISISWTQSQGLLVLNGNSLIGSSYTPETLTNPATTTNMFTIGYNQKTTTAELHWSSMTIIQLFWEEVKRADLLTAVVTTKSPETVTTTSPNTTTGVIIEDHFWNLININKTITVSNDWQLVLIGKPTVVTTGVELTGQNQHIEIPNLNNSCLTNPALCTNGLTIQIKIKFVELEENTIIFTSGGQTTDNPGITLLYRYGFLHTIVSTAEQSWYVSVPRKAIWTEDFCDIIVTWSQHKTLKLIVNEVLIVESESSVIHKVSLGSISNTLTIGGGNTHCIISQLHFWLVHIDTLIERYLISCNLCTQKPTAATTTGSSPKYTTSDYGVCPDGCISSEDCYGEQTTHFHEETSTPPTCVEPTTPTASPPPTTGGTTIEICPPQACTDSTTPWSTKQPTSVRSTASSSTTEGPTTPKPTLAPTTEEQSTPKARTEEPPTASTTKEEETTEECLSPECFEPTTSIPSSPPASQEPTSQGPTSQGPTSQGPTSSLGPTSQGPTSQGPTSQGPTSSIGPTSQGPTSQGPTSQGPSSQGPTSQGPTSQGPTSQRPTSQRPTSQGPTSQGPTSQGPTSQGPTSQGPTSQGPTSQGPTSQGPTSQGPTSQGPTSQGPTSQRPTSQGPTPQGPTSQGPTSQRPTSQGPTSQGPTSQVPTSQGPTSQGPTSQGATSRGPTSQRPTSQRPTSQIPTSQRPTSQRPTSQEPTTEECSSPECEPTTPTPTVESRTEEPTTSTTQTPSSTTAAPTTAAPTTRPSCPPSTSNATLTPEINSLGQGQLTCSVAQATAIGTFIRFTWQIEGMSGKWVKEIEAPDKSATILSTEFHTTLLNKRITCTAEIRFSTAGAQWCWLVQSNGILPSIQCPPVNGTITVIEGGEEQHLQVRITVPPSLLCKAEDNGQCRVEVATTIQTETSELRCSVNEIIPQAVLGVTTVGLGSCGVTVTSGNWQNAITIPIKATVDGVKDGERKRKLIITVRIIGQVSLDTRVENCGAIDVTVVDRDEGATCSSINDPHMKTFDNIRYNNFNPGEFVMYNHISMEMEVRAFYQLCNTRQPRGPTCNCKAAVRSGDDVITFDTCGTRQNQITTFGNSVITVAMYKNGELTPGTRVLRSGCGQKYEVHLPTGTIVTITATRKPFMNINIQASSYDFGKTEGLCGLFNKIPNDDLEGHNSRPDDFSTKWRRVTTIFNGVAAITPRPQTTYCSCLSNRQAVCRQGLDVYRCGSGSIAANDITAVLVSQAKTPVFIGQTLNLLTQAHNRYRRDAIIGSDRNATENQEHFTEEGSTKYCTQYLQNSTAVNGCVDHLRPDAVNGSIANCAEDLRALNDLEWATSHVEDLIEECLIDARTNISAWENINTDGPKLPEFVKSRLCIEDCGLQGSCVNGVCECILGWSGETCQIGPDSVPTVLPALEPCDTLASSCAYVPIDGYSFLSTTSLTCKLNYLTVGSNVTETAGVDIVPAEFISLSQVVCPQKIGLNSEGRSARVTVSNDGITFSNSSFIHILYKSTCQNCILSDDLAGVTCNWMPDSCLIGTECYSRFETYSSDACFWCNPDVSAKEWTKKNDPNCTNTAEPEKACNPDDDNDDKTVIIVLGVLCGVLALVIVGGAIAFCKIRMTRKANMQGLIEREGSDDFYHRQGASLSADLTGKSHGAKENAYDNPVLSS